MGITREGKHKRRETGGRRAQFRKKRKFELGRPAAMTKIGEKRIHEVRARGGSKKFRALRLDSGNFSWGTEVCTRKFVFWMLPTMLPIMSWSVPRLS